MIGPRDTVYEKAIEEFLPKMPGPTKGDKIVQFNRLFEAMWEMMRASFWMLATEVKGDRVLKDDPPIASFELEEEEF